MSDTRRTPQGSLAAAILAAAPDCVIAIDHLGRLLDLNPAAERAFGHGREDVIGQDLATIIKPPGDPEERGLGFGDHLGERSPRILDRRLKLTGIRADGSEFPVELTMTQIPESQPPRFAGFVRDITLLLREHRELEESLEREQEARTEAESLRLHSRRLVAQTLAAEDQERRRLARLLHDGPLQSLFAAQLDLGLVARGETSALEFAQSALTEASEQLREAMFMLHPQDIERLGLEHAVRVFLAEVGRRSGLETSIEIAPDVAGAHDRLLFSLTRELVSNAARHAAADRVSVRIRRDRNMLTLEVQDDGVGVPPGRLEQAVDRGHIGLASSSERVEALGGRLEILSERSGGTLVRVRVPARRSSDRIAEHAGEREAAPQEAVTGTPDQFRHDRRLIGL